MLDKECCTVHRCGTLVLGVFLEKDKLLPLSPVITHYDTHIHRGVGGAHAYTHVLSSVEKFVRDEKKESAEALKKVKIC